MAGFEPLVDVFLRMAGLVLVVLGCVVVGGLAGVGWFTCRMWWRGLRRLTGQTRQEP